MVQLEPGDGVEALQLEDVCEQAVEGDLLRQVVVLLILLLHIRIPSTTVLTLTILYSVGKKPWRIFFSSHPRTLPLLIPETSSVGH